MNVNEYMIDTKKLRAYTSSTDELFAELVADAVEKFMSAGERIPGTSRLSIPNQQTVDFLIDCEVLKKKSEKDSQINS